MDASELVDATLPEDVDHACLVGRVFAPDLDGPCVVAVRGGEAVDITATTPTTSDLFDAPDPAGVARRASGGRSWPLRQLLANTLARRFDEPHLLAPCDLQVIKACGVTFVNSLLERLIEERTKGDPQSALRIREKIQSAVGGAISRVRPGSVESQEVKRLLLAEGLWSQYLEVGIGPDAEVFTKAPVLSAVGTGFDIGVPETSTWNNPEPEVVLAVNPRGVAVGATLGNDVNLRDVEGRSALLLGKAKDNNASCAIGPFVRLFDDGFTMERVRAMDIELAVLGEDGHTLRAVSSMSEISRDPLELVGHAMGDHHHYPDGIVLFVGTMFAPTEDRDVPGQGFTHKLGDQVRISSAQLGTLVNTVRHTERTDPWSFGIRALMRNLAARGLLDAGAQGGERQVG